MHISLFPDPECDSEVFWHIGYGGLPVIRIRYVEERTKQKGHVELTLSVPWKFTLREVCNEYDKSGPKEARDVYIITHRKWDDPDIEITVFNTHTTGGKKLYDAIVQTLESIKSFNKAIARLPESHRKVLLGLLGDIQVTLGLFGEHYLSEVGGERSWQPRFTWEHSQERSSK